MMRIRVIGYQRVPHGDTVWTEGLQVEVVVPLNEEWIAAALYVPFKDDLRLQELRVVPSSDPQHIEIDELVWEPNREMLEGLRPPYGMYPRLLRLASDLLPQMYERAWDKLEHARRDHNDSSPFMAKLLDQAPLHPGERLTPAKIDYLEAAATFARLRPQPPTRQAVAAALDLTPQLVRDRLLAARRAGYLTSPGHGRRGGSLTEEGERLAAHYLNASGRRKRRLKGQPS